MTTVLARAHRILSRLDRYRSADSLGFGDEAWLQAVPFEDDERCIGVYENSPSSLDGNVVITDHGMYVGQESGFLRIRYAEMRGLSVPGDKHSSDRMVIRLPDERSAEVPVVGGRGRFRDAHEFSRFLHRVVEDLDRATVSEKGT